MNRITVSQANVTLGARKVLDNISLDFMSGMVIAIVGPNGAGKSTLLDCLAGLRMPDTGSVEIDGKRLQHIKPRARARQISYLPQYADIAWSIDGITLVGLGRTPHTGPWGATESDHEAVAQAMQRTRTSDFALRSVETLSGGERGRLLLARALATDPQWLLADEPLAGLDPGHALDVMALFRELAHEDGRGVILTLHDLGMALRAADRVIVLGHGQIQSDGSPTEALSAEVLARTYGINARIMNGQSTQVLEVLGRV